MKTNNEKKQYESWKKQYFKSVNEKIMKNNIEPKITQATIVAFELQNQIPTTKLIFQKYSLNF